MDDTRIEWMKVKLEANLKALTNPAVFEDFITREEGINESNLQDFLNKKVAASEGASVLFYAEDREEEEEIEVEIGKVLFHTEKQ